MPIHQRRGSRRRKQPVLRDGFRRRVGNRPDRFVYLRGSTFDLRAGHTIEKTFQAGSKFNQAHIERRRSSFLYSDGDLYYFMDSETFDQTMVNTDILGDVVKYIKDGQELEVLKYGDETMGVELPTSVQLAITETGPSFKGDTAQGGNKPATLETGLIVQVPMFLSNGDIVSVDTRTGSYIERVS